MIQGGKKLTYQGIKITSQTYHRSIKCNKQSRIRFQQRQDVIQLLFAGLLLLFFSPRQSNLLVFHANSSKFHVCFGLFQEFLQTRGFSLQFPLNHWAPLQQAQNSLLFHQDCFLLHHKSVAFFPQNFRKHFSKGGKQLSTNVSASNFIKLNILYNKKLKYMIIHHLFLIVVVIF